MKRLLNKSVLVLMCASMAACTSMRVVADGRDAVDTVARDATHGLHAGESLLVHTRDGQPREMVFVRTDGGDLVGKAGNAEVRVPVANVVRIERKEADSWKTGGLAGGIVLALTALAVGTRHGIEKGGQGLVDAYSGKGKR
jgi:hypothetical protein